MSRWFYINNLCLGLSLKIEENDWINGKLCIWFPIILLDSTLDGLVSSPDTFEHNYFDIAPSLPQCVYLLGYNSLLMELNEYKQIEDKNRRIGKEVLDNLVNDPAICTDLTCSAGEDPNLTHLNHCSSKFSRPKKGISGVLPHLVSCCCG